MPGVEIDLDIRDLQRFSDALERFGRRGIPFAAKGTLDGAAFRGREIWTQVVLPAKLTLRNKWTAKSIRVRKARLRTNIRRMESRLGSLADYMRLQEHGGTEQAGPGRSVPIPTSVASGEGRGKNVRRRVVPLKRRIHSIRLPGLPANVPAKVRTIVAIRLAARKKQRFVFLDLGRRKGIFRVRGTTKRAKIDLVWDLTKASVRVPPSGTLAKTLLLLTPQLPAIAEEQMVRQLRFHRVVGF